MEGTHGSLKQQGELLVMQEVPYWQRENQTGGQDRQDMDEKPPSDYNRGDSSLSQQGSSVEGEKWTDL